MWVSQAEKIVQPRYLGMGSHLWQSIYTQSQVNRVGGKEEEDIYFYGYFHFHLSITVCFAPALPYLVSHHQVQRECIESSTLYDDTRWMWCCVHWLVYVVWMDGGVESEGGRANFIIIAECRAFDCSFFHSMDRVGYWGKERRARQSVRRECLSVCLSFLLQKLQVNYRNYQLSCPIIVTVDCCLF